MIALSGRLKAALNSPANQPIDLYELYLDSGTVYFADQNITWNGHDYLAKVKSRSTIKRYEGGQFDNVSVTFSNVDRTIADLLLRTEIEGRKLIIRKVDRAVLDDSMVLFNGRMERVSNITEEEAVIDAKALIGGIDFDVPARSFSPYCPWELGSFECGYAGAEQTCDKSWARCSQLGNTARFGGFRFFPHSGTYQYKEVEKQRFLLFFSRKKEKTVTAAFNAVDDTPYDVPIPQIFGRVQIAGIDIEHEDQGSITKALVAFCAGPIQAIYYLRANDSYITDWMPHFGQLGGPGGQTTDDQFPTSYPYSLLAYARVNIPSDVKTVDAAPDITAVVEGRGVRIFAADGTFQRWGWSDNPIFCTQEFLTLSLAQGGMGVPEDEVDSTRNAQEATYCDEVIQNTTNDQKIYNPTNLPAGAAYERYRSTSVVESDPTVDGPYSDYEPGVDDDTSTAPAAIAVRRFTMNVALASAEKAVDVLFKKLLPSFRGFITYSKEGKIQIRVEKPAENSLATAGVAAGVSQIPCSNPSQWSAGEKLIASPLTEHAEVLTVAAIGADSLTFTAPTQHAHASGDELLHVEMAFDDSNIVGDFEYPLSDRQATTNRVTIKYVDAPAGFEERELRINDYAHQAKVHRVDNEDLDGSAIDSYFQAWRIGEWKRAKLRDLGKFCSLRVDIKATPLEIGDVIAVSAAEVGLVAVPFRIVEMGYRDDDEVELVAQLYSSAVYDDYAPQATVTVPTIMSAPASATDTTRAPNVTASGVSVTSKIEGNASIAVFNARIALPTTDPTYSALAEFVAEAVSPAGEVIEVWRQRAPFSGTEVVIAGSNPKIVLDASAHAGWSLRIVCYTSANAATANHYTVSGLTLPALTIGTVVGSDAGRWVDSGGALHAVVNVSISNAVYPQKVSIATRKSDGTGLRWHGLFDLTAAAQILQIGAKDSNTYFYPDTTADLQLVVIVARGPISDNAAVPPDAVISGAFTLAAPGAPDSKACTNAWIEADGASPLYYKTTGAYKFGWKAARIKIPLDTGANPARIEGGGFIRLKVKSGKYVAGVWTPGGVWGTDDASQALGIGAGDWDSDTDHSEWASRSGDEIIFTDNGGWDIPSDGNNVIRVYAYLASRRTAANGETFTLVQQLAWSSGLGVSTPGTAAYLEFEVSGAGSGNVPPASLLSSTAVVVAAPDAGQDARWPYNAITADGTQFFSISQITADVSAAADNPNADYCVITAQDYDANKNAIGPEQLFEDQGLGAPVYGGPLMGAYGTQGGSYTRTAAIAYVGLRFYICNSVDRSNALFQNAKCATLQTQIGTGGVLFALVAQGGALPPAGIPATRINSATLGSGLTGGSGSAVSVSYGSGVKDDGSGKVAVAYGSCVADDGTGKVTVALAAAGPLYKDVSGKLALGMSSDFVVQNGQVTQQAVNLAKAYGFSAGEFTTTSGYLAINGMAVNKLVAGTALFLGTATFAYSGTNAAVQIGAAGITLADNYATPTSTVTVDSSGATVQKGTNKVTVKADGVGIYGPVGSLTATASGIVITNGTQNVTLTANSLTVNNGTISGGLVTGARLTVAGTGWTFDVNPQSSGALTITATTGASTTQSPSSLIIKNDSGIEVIKLLTTGIVCSGPVECSYVWTNGGITQLSYFLKINGNNVIDSSGTFTGPGGVNTTGAITTTGTVTAAYVKANTYRVGSSLNSGDAIALNGVSTVHTFGIQDASGTYLGKVPII